MSEATIAAPALPWAVTPEAEVVAELPKETHPDEEEEKDVPHSAPLSAVGLELGQRVEVLWEVERPGTVLGTRSQWWPATVCAMDPSAPVHPVDSSSDEEEQQEPGEQEPGEQEPGEQEPGAQQEGNEVAGGRAAAGGPTPNQGTVSASNASAAATAAQQPCTGGTDMASDDDAAQEEWHDPEHMYCLQYDELDGFPKESCNVAFQTEHQLLDVKRNEPLFYRKAGDAWEPLMCRDDQRSEAERKRDLHAATTDFVQSLEHLGPVKQRVAASAVREVMDSFKEMVEQRCAAEGGTMTVTAEHVHEMFRRMHEKKRQRME